jgi:hypothetical protein
MVVFRGGTLKRGGRGSLLSLIYNRSGTQMGMRIDHRCDLRRFGFDRPTNLGHSMTNHTTIAHHTKLSTN